MIMTLLFITFGMAIGVTVAFIYAVIYIKNEGSVTCTIDKCPRCGKKLDQYYIDDVHNAYQCSNCSYVMSWLKDFTLDEKDDDDDDDDSTRYDYLI